MSEWLFKKVSSLAGCIAIAFLFGLITLASNVEIKDVDLWLHLAAGKFITQNFFIPKVDFLSCTITNTPWINHEWLFQSIVYSIYNNAGIDGLIQLKVWIVFITFVLLLFLGYTREFKIGPIIVLLLVFLVYQSRLTLRPDIFSLLFFASFITIIGMHLDRRWSLWVIAFIQIVWTNMHGFFIFGPMIVLIGIASEYMKRHMRLPYQWSEVGRLSDNEYRHLKQMFLIVVLACLVNPFFIKGAIYPLGILFSLSGDSKVFFNHIQELQRPLQWATLLSLKSYLFYKILIVVSFLSFVVNRRKIDLNVLILWLALLIFSLSATRNLVFFAFAAYFTYLVNSQFGVAHSFLPDRYKAIKVKAFCSVIVKIILIMWICNYGNRLLLKGYYDFDQFERKSEFGGSSLRNFPYKAANFLVDNDIKGNFFNDFNSGAYLLGRASPNIKVFIDGRTEVYGAPFYERYRKIWQGDMELFDKAADQYQLVGAFLNSVYVPAPRKTIRYLYKSKEWVLVYFDYDAAIFLKDIPANQPWIKQYRINLNQWNVPNAQLLKIGIHKVTPYRHVNRAFGLYNMGFDQKAQEEAAEALRIEPYNAKAHKLLGKIYNEHGQYAQAFESLRKAKLVEPYDMKVRYQMALALYHLGEIEKARQQTQRVLTQNGKNSEALFLLSLIYVKEHKYERAMESLKKIHQDIYDEVDGFLKVGDLLERQKEYHYAQRVYAMAMEIDPENKKIQKRLNTNP